MADEYLDIAHGDVRLADALRQIMSGLADNGTGMLREMATDVINGGSLRAAFFSGVYTEAIEAGFQQFWTSYQRMSAEERARLREQAQHFLAGDPDS
jgi:hypothetical protein